MGQSMLQILANNAGSTWLSARDLETKIQAKLDEYDQLGASLIEIPAEERTVRLSSIENAMKDIDESRSVRPRNRRWLCAAAVVLDADYDEAEKLLQQNSFSTAAAKKHFNSEADHKVLWQHWKAKKRTSSIGLKLLGVDPEKLKNRNQRCAVLLPIFEGPEDTRDRTHARHDVLLANDITRLFSDAGLRPPVLEKADEHSLAAFKKAEIALKDERNKYYEVTHAISVGLFSNPFTRWLAELDFVDLTLKTGSRRDERVVKIKGQQPLQWRTGTIKDGEPETQEDEGRARGIMTRTQLSNVTLNVIGGMTAVGTARLGEMLVDRSQELWGDSLPVADVGRQQYARRNRLQKLATEETEDPQDFCVSIEAEAPGERGIGSWTIGKVHQRRSETHLNLASHLRRISDSHA